MSLAQGPRWRLGQGRLLPDWEHGVFISSVTLKGQFFLPVRSLRLYAEESLIAPVWLILGLSAGGPGSLGNFPPELQAKIYAHLFACHTGQFPER